MSASNSTKPRDDALRIWQAGVDAVRPERLLPAHLSVDGSRLAIGPHRLDLSLVGKLVVVGGGKAGAGMVRGLQAALGSRVMDAHHFGGLMSVPADCVEQGTRVELRAGRPAGVNEPQPEGVAIAEEILRRVGELTSRDICICLLSGGGSALLPVPAAGLTLPQKIGVTQLLSSAGASIEQLNRVRRQISRIKGGGLARACRAGTLVTLVISDVLGDPLELIASGPTVWQPEESPDSAIEVFQQLGIANHPAAKQIVEYLRQATHITSPPTCEVHHVVLANNAMAITAAGEEAKRLGYTPSLQTAMHSEGSAEEVGGQLAIAAVRMRDNPGPNCLISGGEPVVKLVEVAKRGLGGRNQQLVLAALESLGDCVGIALLSGGTDGEDGPTDAAGAFVDSEVAARVAQHGLEPREYLARNDAYHFFASLGALIKTGPTHTNVCDLRVITVDRAKRD